MIKTKIVCTMGPAVDSLDKIMELMTAGMNVARLNFSHGSHEQHLETLTRLKEARRRLGQPLAIMLDTKGPEMRIGRIRQGYAVLRPGQKWLLLKNEVIGDEGQVSFHPGHILDTLYFGTAILFDNGYISAHVVEKCDDGVVVEIDHGGTIHSGKGVNIPNAHLELSAVTERDILDIRFGCGQDVDLIAASFIRSAEHVLAIKKILHEEQKPDIFVIAKIENSEGVQNFDQIVQAADGIMVARGDLGVEIPLSHVPRLQKMMIRKSYIAGKPVVTATQMLESMIQQPRPTRAETSDVANAIYDSTSAVMLSGETAIGLYPVETVKVMQKIIEDTESDFNYRAFFDQHTPFVYHNVPDAVTLATVKTAYSLDAKAIFVFTHGGATARLISRLRPRMPIIALTTQEKSYHQLAMNWGVVPVYTPGYQTIKEGFNQLSAFALENSFVHSGSLVVVTASTPFGVSGMTDMMWVERIGGGADGA